jgi:hypothetical protein
MELIEKHGFTKKYGGTFLWGKEDKPWTFNFYRTSEADVAFGDPRPPPLFSGRADDLRQAVARPCKNSELRFTRSAFQGVDDLDAEVSQQVRPG